MSRQKWLRRMDIDPCRSANASDRYSHAYECIAILATAKASVCLRLSARTFYWLKKRRGFHECNIRSLRFAEMNSSKIDRWSRIITKDWNAPNIIPFVANEIRNRLCPSSSLQPAESRVGNSAKSQRYASYDRRLIGYSRDRRASNQRDRERIRSDAHQPAVCFLFLNWLY